MAFTLRGVKMYYYGIVFGFRELGATADDSDDANDAMLSRLSSWEYMFAWKDSTLDFRSKEDVDKLLKFGPDACFQCGDIGTDLAVCESCFTP